jgi:isoleucyl-tRNA synthetase
MLSAKLNIVPGKLTPKATTAYGSDTLRIWAAGIDYTRDASIGPTSISHAAEILRKLRSALRFILGNASVSQPKPLDQVHLNLVGRLRANKGTPPLTSPG